MRCFLSCSFSKEDAAVVDWFRRFLGAFELEVEQGGEGPGPPWDEIEKAIKRCELFCVVVTTRGTSSSIAVANEVMCAKKEGKVIIAFVEDDVNELGCLPFETTHKPFNREALGSLAPEYVRYVLKARLQVLRDKGADRDNIIQLLDECLRALRCGLPEKRSTRDEF